MRLILDAMGGDNAPGAMVSGAIDAAKELDAEIVLVGDENLLKQELEKAEKVPENIKIRHAADVITMEDEPMSVVRAKPESSMAVGCRMLYEGEGDAFISAGNSGAVLTGATLIVKRLPGVKRPCFAPMLPRRGGRFMLADSGANNECQPEYLLQFAIMGSAYMEHVVGVKNPRVGLLNNGSEETKGREFEKQAYELLKNSDLNFIGNVEGRDPFFGACDVVVTDGFTGNIMLKSAEGMGKFVADELKKALKANFVSLMGAGLLSISGGIKKLQQTMNYKEYGGALVMGVNKTVIKAHGNADAHTVYVTLKQAHEAVRSDFIGTFKDTFAAARRNAKPET